MITLITGGTGDGKTALAVQMMLKEYAGRPIFAMGFNELAVEHFPTPPVAEWTEMRPSEEDASLLLAYFTFPANAVVFLDEGQRVFRPRPNGSKVPPEVQAFETHRHTGIDWVITTQFPELIDSNIRRLVKRHIHIHATPVGKFRLEWPRLGDITEKSDRDLASKEKYSPPKEVFGLYKSAEVHTKVKYRKPWYLYVLVIAALILAVIGYRLFQRFTGDVDVAKVAEQALPASSSSRPAASSSSAPPKLTVGQYIADHTARIEGLHHTAPAYDEVTKPIDAPWPVGCLSTKKSCRCIDQQGNNYATTDAICRQIVAHGLFKDWGPKGQDGGTAQPARRLETSNPVADPGQPENKGGVIAWSGPPSGGAVLSEMSKTVPADTGAPPKVPADSPWRHKG